VHYAFGAINGAIYGVLADALPPGRAANGMLFGAALWLGADEIMLWGLGISKKPTEYAASTHVYALASHLVYGLTLETVRRAIRWLA
jgi:putative membrane protein